MKNKEKYAKEIIDIACRGDDFAFDKNSHMVVSCGCVNCYDCLFYKSGCIEERINWSESEYVELPVISKSDRAFLEYLDNDLKYIARNNNASLYVYRGKPNKSDTFWKTKLLNYRRIDGFIVDFPMVKWSDEEPWLIEDLKKLEVVEEYN